MAAVEFKNIDIIFGDAAERIKALKLLDQGGTRETILAECGAVLGVADASISVEKSEICVLMGLSGSGKSTLLRAVNGLNKVSRGAVFIEDDSGNKTDVASCSADTLRQLRMQRVSMVFQQFALLPWRTVAENVGFGLELRGMAKDEITRRVDEKLELVQLSQWRDKKISQLSGGMQQRVGLARAFATDADILLMDEPFSALDPLIRNHLQDELLELQQRLKKTIIFVSHDLDEALKIGSHIAIMEDGRIVQYGKPEEIILNPANDYVARFVAHMNPLNVLKAASLMTPIEQVDLASGELKISLDDGSKLTKVQRNGKTLTLVSADDITAQSPVTKGHMVSAPTTATMREIIEYRHASGNPVLLVEGDKIVGIIGDEEIYSGILREEG
jgi:glycine betaine/proline transport system ATP-binding protein